MVGAPPCWDFEVTKDAVKQNGSTCVLEMFDEVLMIVDLA